MLHSFTLDYPTKRKFYNPIQGYILAHHMADGIQEVNTMAEVFKGHYDLLNALQQPDVNFMDTIKIFYPDEIITTKKVGKLTQYHVPFLYIFEQQ